MLHTTIFTFSCIHNEYIFLIFSKFFDVTVYHFSEETKIIYVLHENLSKLKIKVSNDQEVAQSEGNSHSKNRVGKKLN